MPDPKHRLDKLRSLRVDKDGDFSLGFIKQQFQRDVAKPHKQLGAIGELWHELVPPGLARHTRLEGLSRGVLRVAVDSSAHLYQLDRLLREGLQRQLIIGHKGGTLRSVRLRVADTGDFDSGA